MSVMKKRVFLGYGLVALVLGFTGLEGCGTDRKSEESAGDLAAGCLVNSDCEEPYVCVFERCHAECTTTRDCDGTEICIGADEPSRVCRLEEEAACEGTNDCPEGLLCGVDGKCRDGCVVNGDCIEPQLCVGGVCAEEEELSEDGELPALVETIACRLNSDCPTGKKCALGGCVDECRGDVDCSAGRECASGACVYPGEGSCASAADCPAGASCFKEQCRCACKKDVDCAGGASCDGCACVSPEAECDEANPCSGGRVCRAGTCACECVSDEDCSSGETCDGCACEPGGRTIESATIQNTLDSLRLAGVTRILGTLSISGNDCTGLEHLESVGALVVSYTSSLGSLECLSGLRSVSGRIDVFGNTALSKLGFSPELEVGGDIDLSGNPLLDDCDVGYFEDNLLAAGYSAAMSTSVSLLCSGTCSADACVP